MVDLVSLRLFLSGSYFETIYKLRSDLYSWLHLSVRPAIVLSLVLYNSYLAALRPGAIVN